VNKALLFDFDGLIIDSETIIAGVLIETLASDGIDVAIDDIGHLFGSTGEDNDREWREFLSEHLGENYDGAELEQRLRPLIRTALSDVDALPGVHTLIDAARAEGWRIGLGTGTERSGVLPRLERIGLLDAFDEIVTSEDVERGKPAPDIWLELARRLHVSPEDCIVLEDSPHGSNAAIAAGMAVIVCPCDVTRGCTFADGVTMVKTLEDVGIADLELHITRANARPRR
jgi:putative hydrolase of the HAD superfamily